MRGGRPFKFQVSQQSSRQQTWSRARACCRVAVLAFRASDAPKLTRCLTRWH